MESPPPPPPPSPPLPAPLPPHLLSARLLACSGSRRLVVDAVWAKTEDSRGDRAGIHTHSLTWGLCGRVPTSESGQVSVCARAVRGTTARSWPPQAPGGGLGGWGGGLVRQRCVISICSLEEKVQCELVGGSVSLWRIARVRGF